ncbi:MAG: GspH/FimT family protein [Patescibacteria group bacterium]
MKFKLNKNGFTLLEIVIVLAIIAILALIGFSAFKTVQPNLNLKGASRDLASDLRYAQQLSVTEQVNYSVNFNKSQNSYAIVKSTTGQIIKNASLDGQISIDNISNLTNDTASFNATGAALQAGSITLINLNGATSTIEIKPSGYVKIQ